MPDLQNGLSTSDTSNFAASEWVRPGQNSTLLSNQAAREPSEMVQFIDANRTLTWQNQSYRPDGYDALLGLGLTLPRPEPIQSGVNWLGEQAALQPVPPRSAYEDAKMAAKESDAGIEYLNVAPPEQKAAVWRDVFVVVVKGLSENSSVSAERLNEPMQDNDKTVRNGTANLLIRADEKDDTITFKLRVKRPNEAAVTFLITAKLIARGTRTVLTSNNLRDEAEIQNRNCVNFGAPLEWAKSIYQLSSWTNKAKSGDRAAEKRIQHYYSTAKRGGKLLPALGEYVNSPGQKNKRAAYVNASSFWSILGRLKNAVELKKIASDVSSEANRRYGSRTQLFINPSFIDKTKLTIATAELAGYLVRHPEVAGHQPLELANKTGRHIAWSYDFSFFARTTLVWLGHALNTKLHTGNFKAEIQEAVYNAAKYAKLESLIDNKGDAWDPTKLQTIPYTEPRGRGRELQVRPRLTPALVFAQTGARFTANQNAAIARQITTIQEHDIATAIRDVYNQYLIDHGAALADRGTVQIRQNAQQTVDRNYELTDALIGLFEIPGILFQDNGNRIDENFLRNALNATYVDRFDNDVQVRRQLRATLHNYIVDPMNANNWAELNFAFIGFDQAVTGLMGANTFNALGGPGIFRIVNTLILGADAPVRSRFTENPYTTMITGFHAQVDVLLDARPQPSGLETLAQLLIFLFAAQPAGSR